VGVFEERKRGEKKEKGGITFHHSLQLFFQRGEKEEGRRGPVKLQFFIMRRPTKKKREKRRRREKRGKNNSLARTRDWRKKGRGRERSPLPHRTGGGKRKKKGGKKNKKKTFFSFSNTASESIGKRGKGGKKKKE